MEYVPKSLSIPTDTRAFSIALHMLNRSLTIVVGAGLSEASPTRLPLAPKLAQTLKSSLQITALADRVAHANGDDLLVIASDNYFEFDLFEFISAYDSKNTLVAVCNIGDKSKVHQFGVVQLEGHKIVTFEEKPRKPKSRYVATACYLFPPRVFPLIYEFASKNRGANLGNLVAHLVTGDNVRAYIFTELWVDIGTPETLCHLIETGDTSLP